MQTIKLLEQMQIFSRVAEMASFTRAADSMGLPKASVSQAVQQLEARLGTRLLHRTTRRVQLTQDGQACYERCQDLLAETDVWIPVASPRAARVRELHLLALHALCDAIDIQLLGEDGPA